MTMESLLSMDSCLLHDQSGQENADGLPAEESFRASLAMDAMAMEAAEAASDVQAKLPNIYRSIQCRGATPMARGRHNIDTIVLHTPEGYVPGTLSVLSGTRAGFDWYLPPSGELYKCNDHLRYFSWHAGDLGYNRRSIGIEQWDFAANMPSATDAHYQRLAGLCAYLVETLDLAVRRAKNYGEYGFIAHGTVTPNSRWDPGQFDYDKLLSLVSDLVKGRPGLKIDPLNGGPQKTLNGGPQKKIWLPNLERTAAGAFEENHLDKARVLTLDGKERAVIVPRGVAMRVPKPGEPAENDRPGPVDADPQDSPAVNPERARVAAIIDGYFASLPSALMPYSPVGAVIYDEAKKANLHITSACALVEQESAGRNVFGADWGTRNVDHIPFAHLPVARERVQKLAAHIRAGGVSNGVGLTQLTWRDFIYDAEKRGGAHLPKNQCAVGFGLLAGYYGKYPYLEAIGAYNAGESNRQSVLHTYSAQFAAKHDAWRKRLELAGQPPSEPPVGVNGPQKPAPPKETPTEEKPQEGNPPEQDPPVAISPVDKPPVDKPPAETPPVGTSPEKPETPKPTKAPKLNKAAKAIVAAAVPLIASLMLWLSTGTLDETELSVGMTGLLTALMVYFVPNATDESAKKSG